jgi:hypothetical protein
LFPKVVVVVVDVVELLVDVVYRQPASGCRAKNWL